MHNFAIFLDTSNFTSIPSLYVCNYTLIMKNHPIHIKYSLKYPSPQNQLHPKLQSQKISRDSSLFVPFSLLQPHIHPSTHSSTRADIRKGYVKREQRRNGKRVKGRGDEGKWKGKGRVGK